jgi:UDP-3-O-[3-hydroxymyristoyl] glucosamine N-acyltransferase
MNLEQAARHVGGEYKGDGSLELSGARSIGEAEAGHITFVAHKKYLPSLKASGASAVIVGQEIETDKAQIVVRSPALAFARLLGVFHPEKRLAPGVDPRAAIGPNVTLGNNVTVSALVSLGEGTVVGDDSVLHPGVVVGEGCQIGHHVTIHPNVTLYAGTVIGNHVVLHAGVVVGADGFGYTLDEKGRHYKVPQVGRVVIDDRVEIGANTCIDRAALGVTHVKEGVKIDNLVQVAHNCTLGEHSILVAQVGLAGSCKLGHHVVLAGQVGLADHVTIGDQAILSAQSGTFRDIEAGGVYGGSPSVPLSTWKKYVTVLPKLPELAKKVRDLDARLNAIENETPPS